MTAHSLSALNDHLRSNLFSQLWQTGLQTVRVPKVRADMPIFKIDRGSQHLTDVDRTDAALGNEPGASHIPDKHPTLATSSHSPLFSLKNALILYMCMYAYMRVRARVCLLL